jgi:hypothetical protein
VGGRIIVQEENYFPLPKYFFRIRITIVLGMVKVCAIILDAIRRSVLNKSPAKDESILDCQLSRHFIPVPFRLQIQNTT